MTAPVRPVCLSARHPALPSLQTTFNPQTHVCSLCQTSPGKENKTNTRSLTHQRTELNQVTISHILHREHLQTLGQNVLFCGLHTVPSSEAENFSKFTKHRAIIVSRCLDNAVLLGFFPCKSETRTKLHRHTVYRY